jgi:formate dehydrogenase accessory protein FdhD
MVACEENRLEERVDYNLTQRYNEMSLTSFSFDPSHFTFYESDLAYQPGDDNFPPIAIDEHFEIYINGVYYTTLIMNPVHVEEAVLGLLFGDGIIKSSDEVLTISVDREGKKVEVLTSSNPTLKRIYIEDCSSLLTTGSVVNSNLRVHWDVIVKIYIDFNRRTVSVTRGLAMHTSGLYDLVNRKAIIVLALKRNLDFEKSIAITTGRASSDMILKFANMKVPIVISTRGPLYSGFTTAIAFKITLITYIRRGETIRGLTILTYPERIEKESLR